MVAVALRSVSSVTVTFEVPSVGPTVKGGIMADALIRVGGLLLITPRPRFARTHVIARSIAFWGAATTTESQGGFGCSAWYRHTSWQQLCSCVTLLALSFLGEYILNTCHTC